MNNAFLVGLSRQVVLAQNFEAIANNMANVNTTGYKEERIAFHEHLAEKNQTFGQNRPVSYVTGNLMIRNFTEGPFKATQNPMDVGIVGDGWFVIETPRGERYTRNGAFKINENGEMVTNSGLRVLSQGGPVVFGPDEIGIHIASDGTISSSEGEKGRLRVVAFENKQQMKREENSVFASAETPLALETLQLKGGMLEGSNVSAISETARMIEATRDYTAVVKLIEQMQNLRRESIKQLGSGQ